MRKILKTSTKTDVLGIFVIVILKYFIYVKEKMWTIVRGLENQGIPAFYET